MSRLHIIIFVASLLAINSRVVAQSGQPPIAGARSWGMAGMSLFMQDGYAMLGNQAGLGFIKQSEIITGGDLRFAQPDIRSGFVGFARPLQQGGVGASFHYFGNEFLSQSKLGLAYGRPFGKNLSVGLQLNYLRWQIPDNGAVNVLTFDVGMQALITPTVLGAVHVYSPWQVKVVDNEPLPTLIRAGLRWQLEKHILLATEVEKDIDFGSNVRAGFEYLPNKVLVLRGGVQTRPGRYSLGIGLNMSEKIRLDLAVDYHQQLGVTPAMSLSWQGKK
jgi:hypothetical protein